MKVLVTGANGFIGRNLIQHLSERKDVSVIPFSHSQSLLELNSAVEEADFVVHLAGVNRPKEPVEFNTGNLGFTAQLCAAMKENSLSHGRPKAVIFASSIQAEQDNDYGRSKRAAEEALKDLELQTGIPVHIFRLANVFGKWSRPNYNSVVATFCYNLQQGLPLQINKADAALRLVYVDDVIEAFLNIISNSHSSDALSVSTIIKNEYETTVGEVATILGAFANGREAMQIEDVGQGLKRALYATFMSHLPTARFGYSIPSHADHRGTFSEMLKTQASGQFSFFTAHPGVTRGGHYHHTKCEKFLVLRGKARFRFRHTQSAEEHDLVTEGTNPFVVDTVPGWTHDITNIGDDEMIVMLWASEQFDRLNPDTYAQPL
jgi:UDP-2-acetamido-2,6-beta-L-arabino-hexul-4-ose reductase